jgi:hypothetical protein
MIEYLSSFDRAQLAAVEAAPAPPTPSSFAPGAILASSWGYDQTNVDFYRVEKIKGDWITLQEIAASDASADSDLAMTGRVVPAVPHAPKGEPFRRKLRTGSQCVKISSYEFASAWDGTPQRVSWYA